MVKPSIIIIVFFHLQAQWSSAIFSKEIESFLREPIVFVALMVLITIFLGMAQTNSATGDGAQLYATAGNLAVENPLFENMVTCSVQIPYDA